MNRFLRGLTIAAVAAGVGSAPVRGADYYVATNGAGTPGSSWAAAYTNIQDALNVAGSGDVIFVAGHRFLIGSQLTFPNSGVTLAGGYEGAGTPGSNDVSRWPTAIERLGPANFRIASISGKTGITIRGVTLLGGSASGVGAGLYAANSALTLADSVVASNIAWESAGGGVYLDTCTAVITNCDIRANASWTSWGGSGGGIHCKGGDVTIVGSTIRTNYTHAQNGGANTYGGGVRVESGAVTLRNSVVRDNWLTTSTGSRIGHGIHLLGGTTTIRNCVILNNATQGIAYAAGAVHLVDSIVWQNGDDLVGFPTNAAGVLTNVWSCDIEDGDNTATNGCFSAEPVFVAVASGDYHLRSYGGHWSAAGWVQDYEHSPCIDAGDAGSPYAQEPAPNGGRVNVGLYGNTPQASKSFPATAGLLVTTRPPTYPGLGQVTLNGKLWSVGAGTRPELFFCWGLTDGGTSSPASWGGSASVGTNWAVGDVFSYTLGGLQSGSSYVFRCYAVNSTGTNWAEYALPFVAPFTWYVKSDGSGSPGTSWATALTNIQDALAIAGTGDLICVAGGVYAVTSQLAWTRSGFGLRGGYEGVGAPGSNSPTLWPSTIRRASGSTRVVFMAGAQDVALENVTIADGSLSAPGGGILVSNAIATIAGCRIASNYVSQANGGGIYVQGSTLLVTNCTILANTSWGSWGSAGAGIYVLSGTVTLRDCVLRNNESQAQNGGAAPYGGAVYVAAGTSTIRNCAIYDNSLYTYNADGTWRGDAIYLAGGSTLIQNCTIATNRSRSWVAGTPTNEGIRYVGGTVTLKDSILWENGDDLAGFPTNAQGVLTNVWFCDVEDGDNSGANGCISADPLFASASGRDYHLKSTYGRWTTGDAWVEDAVNSPCIDAGDKASDFSREPVPNGRRVNMGAYGNSAQASKSLAQHGFIILIQ